jgi:hypothetical protein
MEKLTPMGSQNEDYWHEEAERDIEMEMEPIPQPLPRGVDDKENQDGMIIDSNENETSGPPDLNTRKRHPLPETVPRPTKRRESANKTITDNLRQQTVDVFLHALNPLTAQGGVSDLVDRTAKRLESNLFERVSKDRPVNALGRSSTLITASRKPNLVEKYNKEKEMLLKKVKDYVVLATRDDAELEQVQQGEIWEVIKSVLDVDS